MVLSPKSLWSTYNRTLIPLDVSEIRTFTNEHGTEKFVYFNGEASSHGCTRIYARLLIPIEKTDKLVIVFPEPAQDIGVTDFSPLLDKGYAVLEVDYAGNSFDRQRFTIYPDMLSFANYDESTLFSASETPQKTCWYIWTAIALRSLTFAESENFRKIAMFGVGIGGAHVFRAAALSSLPVCAVSLFSPGFFMSDDPSMLNVSASLDVSGYAPLLKIPFLQICCSNDADSSLDDIVELNEQTGGRSILYISPRNDRGKTDIISSDIFSFLSVYLDGEKSFDPDHFHFFTKTTAEKMSIGEQSAPTEEIGGIAPPLTLTANGAEKKLYYSLQCTEKLKDAVIYISHGITNPAYRNWRVLPTEKVGENEYIGYTEVYSADKPIFAFACVTTESGFAFSSPIVKKIPEQLHMTPTTIAKRRLVYDSDMEIDDFFTLGSAPALTMKTGPFDIGGICSQSVICTYKIGDATFSGPSDGVLQLLLFSPVSQKIKFSVIDGEQFTTYSCEQNVSPETDWTKIMLPASQLKSSDGSLPGWDHAIFLRIDSQEEIIISSLLWV